MMGPKYSICATQYNSGSTIEPSLESMLAQIDSDFEIVVADNMSTDYSREVLQRYSKTGTIKLISARCSRGTGRQIALVQSSGDYVISNLDFDDVFKPRLRELLNRYHQRCEGNLLWARSVSNQGFWGEEGFMIAPRGFLLQLGGWNDLQFGEDWELARRANYIGMYRWTNFSLFQYTNPHPERKTIFGKIRYRYSRYRDLLRCRRSPFVAGEHISLTQRIPLFLAKLTLPFYESYGNVADSSFDRDSAECYVDFGE